MDESKSYYPVIHKSDLSWGMVVTTSGIQVTGAFENYPPSGHPRSHNFNYERGRILDEYQLIYLTEEKGYFTSEHKQRTLLNEGALFMLFPGEWHTYCPVRESGWKVYWIGFRGEYADFLVEKAFFTPSEPFFQIGYNDHVLSLFHKVLEFSGSEEPGYQQLMGGITTHLLGYIYQFQKRHQFSNTKIIPVIHKARLIMREKLETGISAVEVARLLNISYVWFRQSFKEYTGFSPGQYIIYLKIQRAKELLAGTDYSVKETADKLGFESADYFSFFFRRYTGQSPRIYRENSR